jgi:2-iminobutanoate/2-iminopropanoate deaminase
MPLPLSKAVRAGGFVFLSGVLALGADGRVVDSGIREQTRTALDRIRSTLADLGLDMSRVVRSTVWLSNLADAPAFNEEYAKYFSGHFPARSAVAADLYGGALVEIEVQALDAPN